MLPFPPRVSAQVWTLLHQVILLPGSGALTPNTVFGDTRNSVSKSVDAVSSVSKYCIWCERAPGLALPLRPGATVVWTLQNAVDGNSETWGDSDPQFQSQINVDQSVRPPSGS